jgi:quercetin dioxygenase-like cupin family protein
VAVHIVTKKDEQNLEIPPEFLGRSSGYTRDDIVREENGSTQMGFAVARLDPGGHVETHVHSWEESLYVLEGQLVVDNTEGSHLLTTGDYGLLPIGMGHGLRNISGEPVLFAEMKAPLPRERFSYDTQFSDPLIGSDPQPIDVRDPRNRYFGHIDPENMDPRLQTQDRLALSASMRTALLVYSGISVKMMVDSDLGADLSTMFMVQYEQGGFAGAHDHPLEEAYLILDGEVEAKFDGDTYHLVPGDVAWAGVGCVHEFRNVGEGTVRWLETQAPQPPPRHSYRFARDWLYLENAIASEMSNNNEVEKRSKT